MHTVGQILKETREIKLYTLEDVEKHTKIRKELLIALENDDFGKLPPLTFIQGFVKNYGRFLGIDTNNLLAILRRDFESKKHPPLILESLSKQLNYKRILLTHSRLVGFVFAIAVLGFFTYLWFEYRQFVGAPKLEVTSPVQGQTVEMTSIVVSGATDPESRVSVNDQEISTDANGNFTEEIKLSSSVNNITIEATSRFGQSSKVERTVYIKK